MHRNLSPAASAEALGFSPGETLRFRAQILALQRLKDVIEREHLTHAEVARRAGTSRSRVTAILNENLEHVSPAALVRIAERVEAA